MHSEKNIIRRLSKISLAKEIWYLVCKYILIIFPDALFYRLLAFISYKRLGSKPYWFKLRSPHTINEKITYLKLHHRNSLAATVADKIAVRAYVKETVGEQVLIPMINTYADAREIILDELPQKFVIKANHGSQMNLICMDKAKLDWPREVKQLNRWLSKNAYYLNREWQYKSIRPRLICEELLEYEIKDFKIFCSGGEPLYIQVDSDRFTNHERSIYTVKWEATSFQIRYPRISYSIKQPEKLEEMLAIAKKLAAPFGFCRVDLYEYGDKIYFGEITIHPGAGVEPMLDYEQELELGKMIDIDAVSLSA